MERPIGRRPLLAGTAVAGLLPARAARAKDADPPCGPMRGVTAGGVTAFLGIHYAAPPVRPLRYASPRPAARWTEQRDCSHAGAAAIQTFGGGAAWLYEPAPLQSEDCLFLNVWIPEPRGRRPVMVWLHGGAWRAGWSDAAGMIGAALARDGDVVVVTINYRLGALGFPEVATAAAYAEALAKRLDTTMTGLRDSPAVALHAAELQLARDPASVRSLGRPPVYPCWTASC